MFALSARVYTPPIDAVKAGTPLTRVPGRTPTWARFPGSVIEVS